MVQLDFSNPEVVRDQQGHILVDEQGNLACTDHNCRLKVGVEELTAAMIREGRVDLTNIARLAFADQIVHIGVDEYDPSVIHSQWIALYRKWGFPKEMRVPKPPFTREKAVEMAGLEEPRIPFYRHPKITLEMLNGRFPAMRGHWSLQPNSGVGDAYELDGWMFLEAALEAPFRNTDQQQLEELAKANGWKGQNLVTYLLFGQYCKDLHDRYPDLETWARLLSSSLHGRVLHAHFDSNGYPIVDHILVPSRIDPGLGGRFAVVP
ncbi:MAG: hypothetical protein Q8O75_03545 [bacterium]|nr:hypothetical protein [bacterium]